MAPHLLTVLLEQPELQALVQLGLLDLPQLQQLLLSGVHLVQQLHDLRDAGLQVRVARHVGGRGVAAGVAAVVAVAALARRKPEEEEKKERLDGCFPTFLMCFDPSSGNPPPHPRHNNEKNKILKSARDPAKGGLASQLRRGFFR